MSKIVETIHHGTTSPITACGFHARYYLPEVYEAAREAGQ